MGKKQHQQDKLYLTNSEWKAIGGHKDDSATRIQRAIFKRLPLNHCSLSLLPYEDPVCAPSGEIFDLANIVPYIKKHGINPCTGKKLTIKDLVHLKFDKSPEGKFRCPITFREFTENSHIVCVGTTGNVYSYETVQELNLKGNHLKDLLNDQPFTRADIITLQDPHNPEKFNIESFRHVKLDLKTKEEIEKEKKEMSKPSFYIRRMNNETREALDQLKKDYVPKKIEAVADETADDISAAHFSQGRVAAGFTSTAMDVVTHNKAAVLSEDTIKYQRVKRNGYVRLITNHGNINLELFAQKAPKACENFIVHCANGYYNNTKFHRVIRNFMMQGGDPTGKGTGGESIWGKPFEDEMVSGLSHDTRGILSMANRGTNTNSSQFFITFRPCKYLDRKHTIFGRVVGGMDVLTSIERVEINGETEEPVDPVIFMRAEVFVDPFEEAAEEVAKERAGLLKKEGLEHLDTKKKEVVKPKEYGTGVGKYINREEKRKMNESVTISPITKKKVLKPTLTDFSSWPTVSVRDMTSQQSTFKAVDSPKQ